MKSEESTYWQIFSFLKGTLGEQESNAFQKALNGDQNLQEELKKHRLANQLIIQNRLRVVREVSRQTKKTYQKNLLRKKLNLVGGILLFCVGTSYLWYSQTNKKRQAITYDSANTINQVNEMPREDMTVWDNVAEKSSPQSNKASTYSALIEKPTLVLPDSTAGVRSETIHLNEIAAIAIESKKEALPVPVPIPSNEKTLLPAHACANVQLKASILASPTCKGENNGHIAVSKITGGKAPYQSEIRTAKGIAVQEIGALSPGLYSVVLMDFNHCSTLIDLVEIKARICEEQERVFNPFSGEIFEIPISSKNGTFIVYEKNGNVFFRKELVANQTAEWNGSSRNGEMETGYFTYEIVYEDGAMKYGTLTITR